MSRRPYIPGTPLPEVVRIPVTGILVDHTKSIRDRATLDTPERRALRERYARNHPELTSGECYAEGKAARINGTACRWLRLSDEAAEWQRGWNEQDQIESERRAA